jgi:hypothetical protein
MGKMLIVNAPWIFSAVWGLIKGFLDINVQKKIHILGGPKQVDVLAARMGIENVPRYNNTMADAQTIVCIVIYVIQLSCILKLFLLLLLFLLGVLRAACVLCSGRYLGGQNDCQVSTASGEITEWHELMDRHIASFEGSEPLERYNYMVH